jgi:4-aminobutyrate--pyruvate transaminase
VGARCGQFCQEEGVIVRPLLNDRIALCPPLVIGEAEVNELFDRFERGLNRTLDWAKAENLL